MKESGCRNYFFFVWKWRIIWGLMVVFYFIEKINFNCYKLNMLILKKMEEK